MDMEEFNGLGCLSCSSAFSFLGAVPSEEARMYGTFQSMCWVILDLGKELSGAQGNLETPTCNESPGNESRGF